LATLKKRYQGQGIDVDNLVLPTQIRQSHPIGQGFAKGTPAGVKVSSVVDPLAHAGVMDHATASIDAIHGDGKLPVIPVRDVRSNKFLGYYQPTPEIRHIGIVEWGDHKELTAVHELGHFIDDKGLPGRGMSSVRHKKLAAWREAAFESESYKTLGKLHDQTTDPDLKQHLKYLVDPVEVWARSYAQYITQKSGSDRLLQQLDNLRKHQGSDNIPRQWPDADFKNISQAIDNLFTEIGWIQ
jgi:hypothetical protein